MLSLLLLLLLPRPLPACLPHIQDIGLHQRPAATGLPSSTSGTFWQDLSTQPGLEAQQGVTAGVPLNSAAAAGEAGNNSGAGQPDEQQRQPQPQVQQPQPQVQYMAPLLRAGEATWQTPPQHLLARPVQQLPLLPHLTKPWVRQQTLRYKQQQQQQHSHQQQQSQLEPTGWFDPLQAPYTSRQTRDMSHSVAQQARDGQQGMIEQAPLKRSLSLSGQVLPPLTVLLQRALDLEAQLLGHDKKG